MKLKTKLLPLVGASAVCATVAPIAMTSCSTNGGETYNLLEQYIPANKLTNMSYMQDKASKLYTLSILDNPDILKEDYLWSEYMLNTNAEQNYWSNDYTSVKDNWTVSNFKVEAFKWYDDATQLHIEPVVTFDVDYDFEYAYKESMVYDQHHVRIYDTDLETKGTFSYKNVPVILSQTTTDEKVWYVRVDFDFMETYFNKNLKPFAWTVRDEYTQTKTSTWDDESGTRTDTNTSDMLYSYSGDETVWENEFNTFVEVKMAANNYLELCSSYYMYSIECLDPTQTSSAIEVIGQKVHVPGL